MAIWSARLRPGVSTGCTGIGVCDPGDSGSAAVKAAFLVKVSKVVGAFDDLVLDALGRVVLGVTKFVGLSVAVIVAVNPGSTALETAVTLPALQVKGSVTGVCAAAALEHSNAWPRLAILTKSPRVIDMGVLVTAQFWRMSW